jgi:hypothetical protein
MEEERRIMGKESKRNRKRMWNKDLSQRLINVRIIKPFKSLFIRHSGNRL